MWRTARSEEEFRIPWGSRRDEREPVRGQFGYRFAVVKRIVGLVVNDEEQVVWSDISNNIGAAGLDGFDGSGRRTMLEDDAKSGEASMQVEESREECLFCVEDSNVVAGWGLAM
jgi:hypothetical protein